MRLTIHKGASEIGGTCIELSHAGENILLDFGTPLLEGSAPLNAAELNPSALVLSHVHQDHYGQMHQLAPSTPVYITELGHRLIDATCLFLGRELIQRNFYYFRPWERFDVAGFRITPYLVDHSTPDAFGFLIEAGETRLYYTGDFRAHGRKSVLFERLIKELPANLDAVIMEGTMMERDNDAFSDEPAVEEAIVEAIAGQTNLSFIIGSSQNIDRLVSAYRACIKANKSLVIDLYTAWILEQLKFVSDSVPNMSWERMRVYFPYKQYEIVRTNKEYFGNFLLRALERRIKKDELWKHRNRYLYLAKLSSIPLFDIYKKAGPVKVIYSQWLGYLKEPSCRVADLQSDPQVDFVYAHTSGHAVLADLKEFAEAMAPKRLIPVHTEYADRFTDQFKNVVRLQDGEALEL